MDTRRIKVTNLNIAVVVMFVIVLLLGIVYFFPSAVDFSFQFDGVLCLPNPSPSGYAAIGIAIALTDIPPRIISIAVVIASLVLVKKHSSTLTGDNRLKIAMVKFTVLLVISKHCCVCGQLCSIDPIPPSCYLSRPTGFHRPCHL